MISYSNCPVCKSEDFTKVMEAKDYTVSAEVFSICECAICNLRFTNPVPNQEAIGRYYKSEDYVSHTNTSKGLINWLYQRVRGYTLGSKKRLLRSATGKRKGKLLDIGSGAGAFLSKMQAAGWQCLGLEPDEDARAIAKRDFDIDSVPAIELFDLPDGGFDAVTMWHVLEHVHSLEAYMEKLRKLISSEGRIVIAVPNYHSKDAVEYDSEWAAYDVPRHLYHFSPSSMRVLLKRHGLKLLKIRIMPFDSFYVSMMSEKNRRGSIARGFWTGLKSYFIALGNAERCSSVIYIVGK